MTVKDLPAEVLSQIFELLRKDDLYTCLFISKIWHPPVVHIYFKELELNALNIYKVKSILSSNDNSNSTDEQSYYFHHCKYTKKLKIGSDTDDDLRSQMRHARYIANKAAKNNDQNDVEVANKEEEKDIANYASKFTTQELQSLLSYLLNLKSIDFANSLYYKSYMTCLADLDNTQ